MTILGAGIVVLAGLYIWLRERQLGSAEGSGGPAPSRSRLALPGAARL